MDKLKRVIVTALTGIIGLLLVLAGQGLIQLSLKLDLYLGIVLLIVSVFAYIPGKKVNGKKVPEKNDEKGVSING